MDFVASSIRWCLLAFHLSSIHLDTIGYSSMHVFHPCMYSTHAFIHFGTIGRPYVHLVTLVIRSFIHSSRHHWPYITMDQFIFGTIGRPFVDCGTIGRPFVDCGNIGRPFRHSFFWPRQSSIVSLFGIPFCRDKALLFQFFGIPFCPIVSLFGIPFCRSKALLFPYAIICFDPSSRTRRSDFSGTDRCCLHFVVAIIIVVRGKSSPPWAANKSSRLFFQ